MIVIDTKVDDLDAFKKDDGNSGNQPVQLHLEDVDEEEEDKKEEIPVKIIRSNKKKSTYVDLEKAKREADELLKENSANAKSNLMLGEKKNIHFSFIWSFK